MTRPLIALMLLTVPAYAGCETRHAVNFVTGQPETLHLCAAVTRACDPMREECVPVFELIEDDMAEPPPAMDVLNAWRLEQIETATGE